MRAKTIIHAQKVQYYFFLFDKNLYSKCCFCILKAVSMKRYYKAPAASTKTFLPPLLTPQIPRKG